MKILSLDLSTKKYVVYLLTFPNGKQYCGYPSNIKRRWSRKGQEYKKCPLVYKAIQKYGWDNIQKEILYSYDNAEEGLLKEKEIIEQLDLLNLDKGYNLIPGGGILPTGSKFLTENGRKKLVENGKRLANYTWNNKEHRQYAIKRMKEETHKKRMLLTKEQLKEKYGKHNLGKIPKNAKSIIQLDLDFNTLQIFSSSVQAAKSIGKETADSTNIRRSANSGGNKIAYGFRWRWKNENS